jgi:polyphosphate kinase
MVVRREGTGLATYCHIGTGNYHPVTARIYTDISLFTADAAIGRDVSRIFNYITGYAEPAGLERMSVSPISLKKKLLEHIDQEIAFAKAGKPATIWGKCNALVDPEIIDALYLASQAGVSIELIVRGICCLRPGVKGVSENITVRSIVDRFLEHSRIYFFENACQPEVFAGSADWMPRNLFRRIEVVFPIEDGNMRERIISEILAVTLADNVKARFLRADGTYRRAELHNGDKKRRSQTEFIGLATAEEPRVRGKSGAKYPRVKLQPRPEITARPRKTRLQKS